MTKNDFLRIARTQGLVGDRRECYVNDVIDLLNFAKLVAAQAAAAEREACAQLVRDMGFAGWDMPTIADRIRNRGTA